jgi:DNA polymerase-3 subunit delta'
LSAGSHPDLFSISIPEKSKNISIDEIRKLSSVISKTAQQSGWKVAIINPAEALNINASNALLKSLEEPQGKTVLILVAHRPTLLSATIRSRCQIIPLTPPSFELATSWLNSMVTDQTNIDKALEISNGRPLLALDYLRSDSLKDQQHFEEIILAVRIGDLSFIDAAQQCAKLDMAPALEWFISYLHRTVVQDKRMQSNQNIYLFLDRINYMYRLIVSGSNVNQQLMWEELLMSWRQTYSSK